MRIDHNCAVYSLTLVAKTSLVCHCHAMSSTPCSMHRLIPSCALQHTLCACGATPVAGAADIWSRKKADPRETIQGGVSPSFCTRLKLLNYKMFCVNRLVSMARLVSITTTSAVTTGGGFLTERWDSKENE